MNSYVRYLWPSNNKTSFYFYYVLFVLIYGEYAIHWNKPWYDNVCAREINIWPWSEATRANVKFWGQSQSQRHHQPTYKQARFVYFVYFLCIVQFRKYVLRCICFFFAQRHKWREKGKERKLLVGVHTKCEVDFKATYLEARMSSSSWCRELRRKVVNCSKVHFGSSRNVRLMESSRNNGKMRLNIVW